MLPSTPSFERRALNRVTFGARDVDEQSVQAMGWARWIDGQLAAPMGDDPALAGYLASQTMRIEYAAASDGSWPEVKEDRPLYYLGADMQTLWTLQAQRNISVSGSEVTRVRQELAAATWIRNSHSQFQLREFMADFWHNHFNIGKAAHETSTVMLPVYDRDLIRMQVFGNFRQLLYSIATSTSMLIYLDNWLSRAATPNENYSREVLELHTLGAGAYLGVVNNEPPTTKAGPYTVAAGFTDQDILRASRALSGWTVGNGQYIGMGKVLPVTGAYAFNPNMHNTQAGSFMGHNLSALTGEAQGLRVLDIAAYHPATAAFIVGKLAKRIFGDTPPQAVIDRGKAAWLANQDAPDQIGRVLRTMLVDGDEVGTAPASKLRRPYEHLIALFRTSDMVVGANSTMTNAFDAVSDFLFAWTPPNGRPDDNTYWLTTGAIMAAWNNALTWPLVSQIKTSLADQTPLSATKTTQSVVEYWVNRMVGYSLSSSAMTALVNDSGTGSIVSNASKLAAGTIKASSIASTKADVERNYRRLVGLISQAPEFMYR